MTVDFVTRARVEQNAAARRRIWRSRDNRYRVVESKSLYGLPTTYYAMVYVGLDACQWDVISKHRKKARAVRACEQHAAKRQKGKR